MTPTDDALLLDDEPIGPVTIADLQALADAEEAHYIASAKPPAKPKTAVETLTEAKKAQQELQALRRDLFRVKAQSLQGLSNTDITVLSMQFNGYLPSEIAADLDIPLAEVRKILASPTAKAYVADMTNEVGTTLKSMLAKGVTVLRESLDDGDPRIRLQAFRELAKINGLYVEDPKGPNSAEDVVAGILQIVREAAGNRPRLTEQRSTGFSRLIEGHADGVSS
jgi:hypothetical protein